MRTTVYLILEATFSCTANVKHGQSSLFCISAFFGFVTVISLEFNLTSGILLMLEKTFVMLLMLETLSIILINYFDLQVAIMALLID